VEIYPTGFSPCDHARVSMWEAMVHQAKAIEMRFERDAIEGGDIQDRCFGEKQESRRSVWKYGASTAREPGTHARR